jgi:hypothetical protein
MKFLIFDNFGLPESGTAGPYLNTDPQVGPGSKIVCLVPIVLT